ncbi:MAG: dihydroorotase [Allomuricauda sp.]|nr:MAG: dihydroorotase [Allomuricauda sp.]
MKVLLKSAKIIAPGNKVYHNKKRDILVNDGIIEKIAASITSPKGTSVIERTNLHVSLGWFDSGVCFGEPGFEERETIANGLKVAAKSGFTDILLNPNTHPSPDTSSAIVFLTDKAKNHAVNLFPIGNMSVQGAGENLAELFDMKKAGAVAFYDYKHAITNANLLKIALLYVQNFDGIIFSYPQNAEVRGKGNVDESEVSTRLGLKGIPALAEELQIARDLFILEYTGGKLHIPTLSTAKSVKLVAEAKRKKLDVSCSVPVHHLVFDHSVLEEFDTNFKLSPPLRGKSDQKALIKGLQDGTIDFVTADHTPIDVEQKRVEFDNAAYGSLGLESAFGALNQQLQLEACITLLTKGRERFGIPTPEFKEGATAGLTLFNPEGEYTQTENRLESTSKNSAFLNHTLKGEVYGILNNGQLIL